MEAVNCGDRGLAREEVIYTYAISVSKAKFLSRRSGGKMLPFTIEVLVARRLRNSGMSINKPKMLI